MKSCTGFLVQVAKPHNLVEQPKNLLLNVHAYAIHSKMLFCETLWVGQVVVKFIIGPRLHNSMLISIGHHFLMASQNKSC